MKRKLIAFVLVFVAACFTSGLASCSKKYPDSTAIDGETYVNGFYDNLYFVGFTYQEKDTALFDTDNHYWWKVEDSPYDMYCALHKEALYWNPVAYCKESQLDEVTAYYNDTANYDYYIGLYNADTAAIKLDGAETDLLENAILIYNEVEGGLLGGGNTKITFAYEERANIRPVLYRVSKDGLFTTYQGEWIIYRDNFYVFDKCDGDLYSAYEIDESASAYIISLYKEYGLLA